MTKSDFERYAAIWAAGNEAGDGFPVGLESDNMFTAVRRDGDTITGAYPYHRTDDESTSGGDNLIIATRADGSQYIVMDCNGPWGVELD